MCAGLSWLRPSLTSDSSGGSMRISMSSENRWMMPKPFETCRPSARNGTWTPASWAVHQGVVLFDQHRINPALIGHDSQKLVEVAARVPKSGIQPPHETFLGGDRAVI